MSRPKRSRVIKNPPLMEGFKPFGLPMTDLDPEVLPFEEYEALRLSDYELLPQEKAALQMGVSRPTYTRIYEKARRTIATALVEGKVIFIEGGDYHIDYYWYRCDTCRKIMVEKEPVTCCRFCQSSKLRALNKPEASLCSDAYCICVHCGTRLPHVKGQPCRETKCPSCSGKMIRENGPHHKLNLKTEEEKNHENCNSDESQCGG